MTEMTEKQRVPDIVLERYRLNELPQADFERVDRLIQRDEALRRRLDAIDASNAAIERAYPPALLADRIRARLPVDRRTAWSRPPIRASWAVGASVAMVVVIIAIVAPVGREEPPASGTVPRRLGDSEVGRGVASEDRIKGLEPALAVYRRTRDGSEPLADGAVARAGDLVRVAYRAAGRPFGAIVSIDGRGTVTRHLPTDGDRSAQLRPGTILLDTAYELDDAPSWERFYFITAAEPFDLGPILDAARHAASGSSGAPPRALGLPAGFEQSTFSLQKEATR